MMWENERCQLSEILEVYIETWIIGIGGLYNCPDLQIQVSDHEEDHTGIWLMLYKVVRFH